MKKLITIFLLVAFLMLLSGCVDVTTDTGSTETETSTNETEKNNNSETSSEIITQTEAESSSETSEPIAEKEEIIYEDNESIQKFLTQYNKLYPDAPITKDMISKYHHHGSDHDDQVVFYLGDHSITLSDTTGFFSSDGYKASVFIDNNGASNDGIKSLFFKFMRVYDSSLTDDTLEQYWDQQTDDYSNTDKFGDIECYTVAGMDNHVAQYIKIDGKFLTK